MSKNRRARRMTEAAAAPVLSAVPAAKRFSAGRATFFALFAASGFAGLIYESIWTHYLKLFLGHAAYAQALVLAIFMGGMAIGSWLAARWSGRWRNLLLGYALTEVAVAALALVFHEVFVASTGWAHEAVLPHFAGFKWVLSAALILPQCVLLGMTFPLLTAGVLRRYADRPGRSLSMLYFTNSLGAAAGVLVSGFVLVRAVGLPGTIRIAGGINLLVAGAVFLLVGREPAAAVAPVPAQVAGPRRSALLLFLGVALVTGASSFIYEVAWIRMLSLVLGASTHSFELMLSAFIFGLALGGLWIQRRIDRLALPVRTLAWMQMAMGFLALCTLPLYGKSFEIMAWLVRTLPHTDAGFPWFLISANGIALTIMLPATFCAGTTLPLVTFHLLQRGHGEASIGAVYSANTVGAIAGVFFAVHLGFPLLGLKGLLVFGSAIDLALGALLLWTAAAGFSGRRVPLAWSAAGAAAVALFFLFAQVDPMRMASGVYRSGKLLEHGVDEVLFHRDGKTATVDVIRHPSGIVEILTNGKSDAGVVMKPGVGASADEPTMILLGAVAMALHPEARRVACIGFGSGLTTQTLLGNPAVSRVDTIEIEPEMVHGAENFRPRNERAFTDPRSRVVFDDAKTYFSGQREKYDLIISEPSNPWVSGVAGLFSDEFYRLVRRHLADGGLFGQWLQLYEIDAPLVVSVLKALEANFSDYVVYASTDLDLLIVAKNGGTMPPFDPTVLDNPEIADALARIGVRGMQDVGLRQVGTRKSWEGLTASFPTPMNSDYRPVLDQGAARTFFLRSTATELTTFQKRPFPAVELLSGVVSRPTGTTEITAALTFRDSRAAMESMYLFDVLVRATDPEQVRFIASDELHEDARAVSSWLRTCGPAPFSSLVRVLQHVVPDLSIQEVDAIFRQLGSGPCAVSFSPVERQWLTLLRAVGWRDPAGMASASQKLLSMEGVLGPQARHYAVAAGMLGAIAQGDSATARGIWLQYGGSIDKSRALLLRTLVTRSGVARR